MTQAAGRSREDVVAELTAAMKSCLESSGRTLACLTEDQCPLTTVKGFDSLCGIEVTVDLQERLKIKLDDNIFVEDKGGRPQARSLKQVVDSILSATKLESR